MFDSIVRTQVIPGSLIFFNKKKDEIFLIIVTDPYTDEEPLFEGKEWLAYTGVSIEDLEDSTIAYEEGDLIVYFMDS